MSNSSPANSREDVQVTPIPAAPRRDVADTVALILRLEKRTMGMAAQQAFQTVEAGQDQLLVPAMVCSEIMYLAERKRIAATLGDVERYLDQHQIIGGRIDLAFAQWLWCCLLTEGT